MAIYWRDQSQSSREFRPRHHRFPWTKEDIDRLRQMVESNTDQVELLAAFPGATWRAIREFYGYHFVRGLWHKHYRGRVIYDDKTRWQDTAEYRAVAPNPQHAASEYSSCP